jgi:hypothetical protein
MAERAAFTTVKLFRDCLRLADYVSTQVREKERRRALGPATAAVAGRCAALARVGAPSVFERRG